MVTQLIQICQRKLQSMYLQDICELVTDLLWDVFLEISYVSNRL